MTVRTRRFSLLVAAALIGLTMATPALAGVPPTAVAALRAVAPINVVQARWGYGGWHHNGWGHGGWGHGGWGYRGWGFGGFAAGAVASGYANSYAYYPYGYDDPYSYSSSQYGYYGRPYYGGYYRGYYSGHRNWHGHYGAYHRWRRW